ncbi:hypothetical protein CYME_CMG022C [Cyanidioschyzon merolae strain 10D]|uniref:Uncharacterized protein n=1 Tax=Cyanidioschyzon merolae (strain NIES-3377 / 10D) TaxID=280699 RepID=M1V4N7_CYAM1|nr:hypothetical protein CYME_CMG022C [Cyanidioschyzon merolae strain 10D]BAM79555.1 hypothetical protein CYME_CMG022C [Cyanidioschyzon merolae strain 10D]|eukprot:XP_005535841.1 hypothetical protein CYME_CMG022C [Cyanidioschyzon merolae strain 10D]
MHQVLHPGVRANCTIAVVPLGSQDRFECVVQRRCRYVPQRIGSTREGLLFVMSATHAAADENIGTFQLTLRITKNDDSNVVCVDVDRIIPGNSDTNFELARKVQLSVKRLDGILQNLTTPVILRHESSNFVHVQLLLPVLDAGGKLPIEPQIRKRVRLNREQLCHHSGNVSCLRIRGIDEGRRRRDDVARAVAARTIQPAARSHDALDDGFQIGFMDAVDLERRARREPQRLVPIGFTDVVECRIQRRRTLAGGHFQTEHELVFLELPANTLISVILEISAMELDKSDAVIGDEDLVVAQFFH